MDCFGHLIVVRAKLSFLVFVLKFIFLSSSVAERAGAGGRGLGWWG